MIRIIFSRLKRQIQVGEWRFVGQFGRLGVGFLRFGCGFGW